MGIYWKKLLPCKSDCELRGSLGNKWNFFIWTTKHKHIKESRERKPNTNIKHSRTCERRKIHSLEYFTTVVPFCSIHFKKENKLCLFSRRNDEKTNEVRLRFIYFGAQLRIENILKPETIGVSKSSVCHITVKRIHTLHIVDRRHITKFLFNLFECRWCRAVPCTFYPNKSMCSIQWCYAWVFLQILFIVFEHSTHRTWIAH